MMPDFKAIAATALGRAESLLAQWLPDGKRVGHEWQALNPLRADSKHGSFSINLNTGAWADFATGDKGGDLVALYAYLFINGEQGKAARELADLFGIKAGDAPDAVSPAPTSAKKSPWVPVMPAPTTAQQPPVAHIKRGKPEATWQYRDAEGRLLGVIYRFRTSEGGKEVLPCCWCRDSITGQEEWHWMAFADPRPLYGLDRLAARPDATVLIVEGEKCADAAQAELPDLVVMSWPGGSKAVSKAHWQSLAGRKVIVWADCDAQRDKGGDLLPAEKQPGNMAAAAVARTLAGLGCRLWLMRIPAPGEKPSGWDVADAIADGLRGVALAEYIRAQAQPYTAVATPSSAPFQAAASDDDGDWAHLLIRKNNGDLVDCRENVYLLLEHHPEWRGKIARDEFSYRIVKQGGCPIGADGEWEEEDDLRLGLWLAQRMRFVVRALPNIGAGVVHVAANHKVHPVRAWLNSLEWDGVVRLEDWLTDFLGVRRSPYSTLSGAHFLIALVARVMQPGCLMRQMPVLEGGQYAGKSTALRILGGEWFGDTLFKIGDKDAYQVLRGKWLYEVAELDAFNRAEAAAMKGFISSPVDTYRASYARESRDWLRQVVFAGTTNHDEYFKDSSGNTRYVPWLTEQEGRINLDGLVGVRDQLFAEAVVRFKRGDRWHPTREEQSLLFDPEQESREIPEIWTQLLAEWLEKNMSDSVTMADLIGILKIDPGKIDGARGMATRIGNCMRKLGWRVRQDGSKNRVRRYMRPQAENAKDDGSVELPI